MPDITYACLLLEAVSFYFHKSGIRSAGADPAECIKIIPRDIPSYPKRKRFIPREF